MPKENLPLIVDPVPPKQIQSIPTSDKNNSDKVIGTNQVCYRKSDTVDLKIKNQVDFLYSIWNQKQKHQKKDLLKIKSKQQASVERANVNSKKDKVEQLQQNSTQNSTFYKINHPRNKVTNSHNYVLRKSDYQFVCKEKEQEVCQFTFVKDPMLFPSIEDDIETKAGTTFGHLAVNKVIIKIEDGLASVNSKQDKPLVKKNQHYRLSHLRNLSHEFK